MGRALVQATPGRATAREEVAGGLWHHAAHLFRIPHARGDAQVQHRLRVVHGVVRDVGDLVCRKLA